MTSQAEQCRKAIADAENEERVHVGADQQNVLVDERAGHFSILQVELGNRLAALARNNVRVLVVAEKDQVLANRVHMRILHILADRDRLLLQAVRDQVFAALDLDRYAKAVHLEQILLLPTDHHFLLRLHDLLQLLVHRCCCLSL